MKFAIIFATCTALYSGSALVSVPGDNSHYIEGESRYIWMPDGDGDPQLVDLQEPVNENLLSFRNADSNQYWLFTRLNPTSPQVIVHGNASTIWESNYSSRKPLKVLVHGWTGNGNSTMNPLITSAFLAVQDCNIIVFDWRGIASTNYVTATNGVPGVGQFLGKFLIWLIDTTGGDWNLVYLIGFSLGAHVVGNAGRTAEGKPNRVSGLDPAGPLWIGNSNALSKNSGQYVEAIHTDGGILGFFDPMAHVDFYPNGGKTPQPGCTMSTCSHSRAPEFFASTVRYDLLVARQCANIREAERISCSGVSLNMGSCVLSKRGSGIYGLRTGKTWPF